MADRWLRSRSSMRNEDSFNNVDNINMNNDNTNLESEANITVRANPLVEVSVQNFEVVAHDSNKATLSNITTSQLQDLLTTVMAAIQVKSTKQTAAIPTEVAKLTEIPKAHFKQENYKIATSLAERFEAANTKWREEFNAKLQHEIQGVSNRHTKE